MKGTYIRGTEANHILMNTPFCVRRLLWFALIQWYFLPDVYWCPKSCILHYILYRVATVSYLKQETDRKVLLHASVYFASVQGKYQQTSRI